MTLPSSNTSSANNMPRISFAQRHARLFMGLALMLVDLVTLALCGWLAFISISWLRPHLSGGSFQSFLPFVFGFILAYLLTGLYVPGVSPVDELRRLFVSTTIMFLFLLALLLYFSATETWIRVMLIPAWLLTVVCVPLARSIIRKVLSNLHLWGEPIAVIGYGNLGYRLVNYLISNPMIGFSPAVVIDRRKADRPETRTRPPGIIVKSIGEITEQFRHGLEDIRTAILVVSETPGDFYESITDIRSLKFSRLIIVSLSEQHSNLWLQPYDLGGIIGLEIGQNLLNRWQQAFKRVIDLLIIFLCLPFIIPVVGILSLLIVLDSRGSIFYASHRLGKGGKLFRMWKFRTMVANADQIIDQYLEKNPEMLEEWKATQKLKNDPRVTRMGRFLRKLSLDELPQLWNIVIGEMSLVGPRPIVAAEKDDAHYGKCYNLYIQVRPGLTGLWQVSGRNDISYAERVRMDEYYVRNWSVWLDLIILARTPQAVLEGRGAY